MAPPHACQSTLRDTCSRSITSKVIADLHAELPPPAEKSLHVQVSHLSAKVAQKRHALDCCHERRKTAQAIIMELDENIEEPTTQLDAIQN